MMIKKGLGWLPDFPDTRDQIFHASKPKDFTRIHDLRWSDVIPPVRDQKELGSCTGFGVTGIAWSAMFSDKTFDTLAFHPSELFAYYNGRRNKLEDTGASIRDVMKSTINFGLSPLYAWSYDVKKAFTKPSDKAYQLALKFKTIRYARIEQTEQQIINTLASGFPIVFGHTVYENFWSVGKYGVVPLPKGRIDGGHCEYMMAYNLDNKIIGVQNSWGTKRGDRGYEWFKFDHILNPDYVMDLWTVYEVSI